MKTAVNIARWLVGLLFIISGLVKVNDPSGLSYKMQEFFEVWGWHIFHDYSLLFAIVMNVFEVVAGLGLLLGQGIKLISSLLLLLITLFTFLTAYALFSGKIATCGCLGDCLPLLAYQSFIKDLILLVLSVFIVVKQDLIQPLIKPLPANIALIITALIITLVQQHVLNYLPFVDCLPYKVGNNIQELMKKPAGATSDVFDYVFQYKKQGKVVEYPQDNIPDNLDSTYEFVGRKEKLIKKGNGLTAKIVDFSLKTATGTDTTESILNQPGKYVLLFAKEFPKSNNAWFKKMNQKLLDTIEQKGWKLFIVTADIEHAPTFKNKNIVVLSCDATVIKTAARVNPTYFIMDKATILHKFSYADESKIFKAL